MTAVRRLVVFSLVFSLALSGPLAQLASAQQTQPAQPSEQPQQPTTPEPDLFQEALKAAGQVPGAPTSFQPPPPAPSEPMRGANGRQMSDTFYDAFAGVATAFLIPGRALTCVLGGGVAFGVFVISLGTGYRGATRVMEEGCGGKWIVHADDLRPGRTQIDMPVERY